MPEMGFQEQPSASRGGGVSARDSSPDSVIFTLESNFCSLFSSASASVDRCSFASDAHDRESLTSEISLHLAGPEHGDHRESSSGPDLDPDSNKPAAHITTTINKHSRFLRKGEKVKDSDADFDDENRSLDSARNSFSLALKECQDRRSRSEALSKKPDRRRPASLDLNNVAATSSSPRLGTMKKSSALSSRRSGTFPSPGTPNYRQVGMGMQKGWSSERVPSHTSANRRQAVNSALLPFNNGRSTLPSKWEDAERWIFSPVSGDGVARPSFQPPQRRPKSKSGPLGPPGIAYYSLYSPAMPIFDAGNVAASPFLAGVIAADGQSMPSNGDCGTFPGRTEACMARSVSVHGYSEMLGQLSLPGPQDEKLDWVKDAGTDISRDVSRRDMATQMSPEGSSHSSPEGRLSFSALTPPTMPVVELQSVPSSKVEVRDVQVDERVTMTRWSKKNRARFPGKSAESVDNWKKKGEDAQSSDWDVKSISKSRREEAKITAWENLQKAKAEAAIRKLEMKLEKKRSSSMDKIMSKLRSAQKRAQDMRSSVLANQAHQVTRTSHKALSFRRTCHIGSLNGCFTCHAF